MTYSEYEFFGVCTSSGDVTGERAMREYTDKQLMDELERRFMDLSNLEGNKIWSWMNNYSCGDEVMATCGKRAQIRREEAARLRRLKRAYDDLKETADN